MPISDAATMDEVRSAAVAASRLPAVGLALFGGVALALGASGIFGVISYLTHRRRQEIGVRFALGAERRHVLRDVMLSGLKPVAVGVLLGLLASLALSRWVASLLYQVSPTDPAVATGVVAVLFGTASLACYPPARRAARVDPMTALRTE